MKNFIISLLLLGAIGCSSAGTNTTKIEKPISEPQGTDRVLIIRGIFKDCEGVITGQLGDLYAINVTSCKNPQILEEYESDIALASNFFEVID